MICLQIFQIGSYLPKDKCNDKWWIYLAPDSNEDDRGVMEVVVVLVVIVAAVVFVVVIVIVVVVLVVVIVVVVLIAVIVVVVVVVVVVVDDDDNDVVVSLFSPGVPLEGEWSHSIFVFQPFLSHFTTSETCCRYFHTHKQPYMIM
jgi:peptidoglycan/LPS O-acetylase OafA/YrhL